MENELNIIDERELLGKQFRVYGDFENPLFLAKDVAEWIDYSKSGNGSYNLTNMLKNIDEDEKLILKFLVAGQMRDTYFLTEDGLYEVLMLSTKPIAKQFKKEVKKILKLVRKSKMSSTHKLINNLIERLDNIDENRNDEIETYESKIYVLEEKINNLEEKNKKLENEIRYLYSDEDFYKKCVIKNNLSKSLSREDGANYNRLYRLFKKIYGISLKQECDIYNRKHKDLPNISVLYYCLIKGYIKDLYTCYETLFVER